MRHRPTVAIVGPPLQYGDTGPFSAVVGLHRYLHCSCGHRLHWGETTAGATVFACLGCKRVSDVRRVP